MRPPVEFANSIGALTSSFAGSSGAGQTLADARYRFLCGLLPLLVRCGVDERDLEAVVLRRQLKILARGGMRPRFTTADRALLAAAARLLSRDRWRSFLVGPDTLLRWHRELLGRRPRGPCRRPGRPPLDPWDKELIRRLGRENPRWGYLRILGELLKLGIDVSATTIATVLRQSGLRPAPRRIGPTWTEFLRLQAYGLLCDSSRSDQDDNPEDVASDPPEALTPVGEDPATTEHEEPVQEDPSAPSPRILVTVHAGRRAWVTVVPPGVGVHARDGPAIAA